MKSILNYTNIIQYINHLNMQYYFDRVVMATMVFVYCHYH